MCETDRDTERVRDGHWSGLEGGRAQGSVLPARLAGSTSFSGCLGFQLLRSPEGADLEELAESSFRLQQRRVMVPGHRGDAGCGEVASPPSKSLSAPLLWEQLLMRPWSTPPPALGIVGNTCIVKASCI